VATFVYDGTRSLFALYLDGREVGTLVTSSATQYHHGWWRLGGGNLELWTDLPRSFHYQGDLGELRIFPHFLSAEEALSLDARGLGQRR
jgi:hypothetical protein